MRFQMSLQSAPMRGGIFTVVAFWNPSVYVIFVLINVHDFIQFDASSFAAFIQLTQIRKIISLRHLQYRIRYDVLCDKYAPK